MITSLLPRSRQGQRARLPAAPRGDARDRSGRRRVVLGARQGVHRRAAPVPQRPDHAPAALRRRGQAVVRGPDAGPARAQARRARPGQADHPADRARDLRTREVQGRGLRADARADRAEGRRSGDHDRPRGAERQGDRPDGSPQGQPRHDQGRRAQAGGRGSSQGRRAQGARRRAGAHYPTTPSWFPRRRR